jgi:hypothetical protein
VRKSVFVQLFCGMAARSSSCNSGYYVALVLLACTSVRVSVARVAQGLCSSLRCLTAAAVAGIMLARAAPLMQAATPHGGRLPAACPTLCSCVLFVWAVHKPGCFVLRCTICWRIGCAHEKCSHCIDLLSVAGEWLWQPGAAFTARRYVIPQWLC